MLRTKGRFELVKQRLRVRTVSAEHDMRKLLRAFLDKRGYVLWNRNFFRFGISPFVDMGRLNAVWGRSLDVLFDVGANVGQFANEARRELPATIIHSFEPHPRTFQRLTQSKADSLMFCHCLALAEEVGDVILYEYGTERGWSHINSLVPNARFPVRYELHSNEITVSGSTLDHFCATHSIAQIDFLKIDVEGAELAVLKGGKNMLSHNRIMAVYFEFNDLDTMPGASGGGLMPIARYLANFGMRYACTYTDFLLYGNELNVVANALFVLPPHD